MLPPICFWTPHLITPWHRELLISDKSRKRKKENVPHQNEAQRRGPAVQAPTPEMSPVQLKGLISNFTIEPL